MKIDFDFDGVVVNSHPLKAIIAKERFGVDIPPEQFRREIVLAGGLLSREQYREVGRLAMNGSYPIPPVPEVFLYLSLLLNGKNLVRIVTSRTGEDLEFAKKWLAEHDLPDLPIIGTGYGLPKTEVCNESDVFVDDDLEKLLPLMGVIPNLLFFSWPWNAHEKEPDCIHRVSSWWDLYNHIWYDIRQRR